MDQCIFKIVSRCCDTKNPLQNGGPPRINTIIEASKTYEDNLHEVLEKEISDNERFTIKYHNNCIVSYASKSRVARFLKRKGNNADKADEEASKRTRRSDCKEAFCFKQQCLFCTKECIMDRDSKNPGRWRQVVVCRTADCTGLKTLKENIIETCDARQDEQSIGVKMRVMSAISDLHAADARYHKDCFSKFMSARNVATAKRKMESSQKEKEDSAFYEITREMDEDKQRIWNSVEVYNLYKSKEGKTLSRRSLMAKLSQHFGSELLVLHGTGIASILLFWNKASSCLNVLAKEENDEIEFALETTAQKIKTESKDLAVGKTHYSARLNMEEVLDSVSPTLVKLLGKVSDKLDYTMPAALIGNIVTSLVSNTYTALQIALSVLLGKRNLIEQFHEYSVVCSYHEFLLFKSSAAAAAVKNSNLTGLRAPTSGLIQVIADNFDANISSQNGLLNTHSLAMILAVCDSKPAAKKEDGSNTFPRLSFQDAQQVSIPDIPIERYRGPKKPVMPDSEAVRTVLPLYVLAKQVVSISRAKKTDFDFLCNITNKTMPEFSGFNTQLAREQGQAIQPQTRAIYRPLIDMSPADPDTMMTAMVDAQNVTNSCGQKFTIFTNDQQLYKVAVGIKWVYQDRFLNFIPRLGGMHFVMSFIGSVGSLMANTGLKDIMKAAFGGVPSMLSGEKFLQNARALRIVVEELISCTVKNASSADDMVTSLNL